MQISRAEIYRVSHVKLSQFSLRPFATEKNVSSETCVISREEVCFKIIFNFLLFRDFEICSFFFLNKFNFFNRFKFSSQSCSWRQDEFSDLDNYKIGVPIRDHSKLIFVEHPEIISDLWCSKWWPWGVNTLIYSGPKRQLHALQCLKIAFGQLHTGHPVYLLCSFSRSSSHEAREIGN